MIYDVAVSSGIKRKNVLLVKSFQLLYYFCQEYEYTEYHIMNQIERKHFYTIQLSCCSVLYHAEVIKHNKIKRLTIRNNRNFISLHACKLTCRA